MHRPFVLYNAGRMPSLHELRRKARTISVQWEIEPGTVVPVQVTYDPSKITMDSQTIPVDDPEISLGDFWSRKLQEYIVGWDIQGEDGALVPVTKEGIGRLEAALVQVILNAVQNDARPNLQILTNT